MRDILKGVADLAVEVATAGREAMSWEVWEGHEVAGEPEKARVARRDKPSKKELHLWKRLEEIDKEIANEEKRASEKKKRAVERARKVKGAGANQPSILSKLKPVAKSSNQSEMPVNSPSSVGEEHGDGVCSGDSEHDGGLSGERQQHSDDLHSVVGVAEVQNLDVGKSSEDVCGTGKSEVSVAQLSSQYMNITGENRCPDVVMRLHVGVVAAVECGMSVALLNKSSECVEPSSRMSEVHTNSTQKNKEIANTKASRIINPTGGTVGFQGKAGPSKGRGEVELVKTDSYISFRKPKVIHPRVAKYHKMFEGNRKNVEKVQDMKSSPLKRKLKVSKNTSYLVEIFSRDTESNPKEESEIMESPAKRTKYFRFGGGGGGVGDLLED